MSKWYFKYHYFVWILKGLPGENGLGTERKIISDRKTNMKKYKDENTDNNMNSGVSGVYSV